VEAGDIPDPNEEPPVDETMPPDTQGEGATPDVGSAEASPAPDEAMPPMKALDDLDRWERKAIKALKRTGKALVGFESDAIDDDEHDRITEALRIADSIAAVKAAFKQDATDKLLESVDADARSWAADATGETKALAPQPIVIVNQAHDAPPPHDDSAVKAALADVQQVLAELADRPAPAPLARTVVKEVLRDAEGRIVSVIEREQYDAE
jgi:hypothetical protein